MDIGILTYYSIHNHGSLLQANALRKVLASFDHHVIFLRYKRNYDFITKKNKMKYSLSLLSIPFYIQYLFKKGIGNIIYNIKKRWILCQYLLKNIPLGEHYSDFKGDIAVIGSDEVFSLEIGINPFFFGYGIKAKKIFSYAGCFGPTTITFIKEHSLIDFVKSGFDKMVVIGVRDENSKQIADILSERESILVCDPVLLYGYQKEIKNFIPKEKNYIVIYSYDKNMSDPLEIEQIKTYAKNNQKKLISVGYYHKWCDKNVNAHPEELLGWFHNADLVITDTFHGAVFSMNCNTQFIVKLRDNQNKLEFLLKQYDLSGRIINDFSQIKNVILHPIDFSVLNSEIAEERNISMKFITSLVEANHDFN